MHPIVDLCFARSFAQAWHPQTIPCLTSSGHSGSSSEGLLIDGGSNLSSSSSELSHGQEKWIPQSFVAQRCLATFFRQVHWHAEGLDPNFDKRVIAHPTSGLQGTHAHTHHLSQQGSV